MKKLDHLNPTMNMSALNVAEGGKAKISFRYVMRPEKKTRKQLNGR
jgi:hypothetical protein